MSQTINIQAGRGFMANRWFAFLNGVVSGPYEESQLKQMLVDNKISFSGKISREGEFYWKTVAEFSEFNDVKVPEKAAPAPEAVPPQPQPAPAKKKWNSLSGFFRKDSNQVSSYPDAADQVYENGQVRLACPHCGQHYMVEYTLCSGQNISCQACGDRFVLNLAPEVVEAAANAAMPDEPVPVEEFPLADETDFSEEVPDGDIVCPHCWKTFSKEYVCYISSHPDLIGDAIAGEFEQKRFIPTVYHSSGLPLDARGLPCTDTACPHCHLRLPASVVDLGSIYFSIAGAPSSGKSYFLTSMIHALRRNMPQHNLSFYDVDPIINSVINGYEDAMFMAIDQDAVVSLPKTQQIGSDFSNQIMKNGIAFELPKPFIFRMQSVNSGSEQSIDSNIIFYDNAGEHFQPGADSVANPATKHLAHSDGIIFLFDPFNDARMRKACDQRDPQTELNTKIVDQTTLFAEMVNRIRRHSNLNSCQNCDIPLIVAVGKYDTWRSLLPKNIDELQPLKMNEENFSLELDWNTILDVSFALREMMQDIAPALVAQAETFFEKVIFVPVSSFGCLASQSESGNIGIIPSRLNPVWVDTPINLLLAETGIFNKVQAAGTENLDNSLKVKVQDGYIIFQHPVSGKRVMLPALYENVVLEIGGKKYKMPQVQRRSNIVDSGRRERKTSVWE